MRTLKLIFAGIMCLTCLITSGQINPDDQTEILLKTGYLVRGKVIENVPGEIIVIETLDGTRFTYQYSDIETIGKSASKTQGSSFLASLSVSEMHLHLLANVGFGLSSLTNKDDCYGCELKSVFKLPALLGLGVKADYDSLISFNAELNLERKGYKLTRNSGERKSRMSYLSLPIYASISYPYNDLVIFAQAGGYAALKLNDKTKHEAYYSSSRHKDLDFGWLVGAGVELPYRDQISLRAQLRYTRGLTRAPEYYKMRNQTILVLVSVAYSL